MDLLLAVTVSKPIHIKGLVVNSNVMYKYLQTQTLHASEMVTAVNGTYLMIHGFLFVMILL
jgi:hypothetical protein